jgi:uncharacterized protein DUF1553/uncharacterized protein DUF1549
VNKLDSFIFKIQNTFIPLVCHLTTPMNLTKIACLVVASLPLFASGLIPVKAELEASPRDLFAPKEREYWGLQRVQRPKPPAVEFSKWVSNPIDAFILSDLEAKGLRPAPPADKITLLRRVTLDLIGLPPTPDEVEGFLADSSPQAYETVVDRLLSSPRYGERWARHWLDLARYAESEGFKSDETRPNAWRYRDYVIRSFNSDKPYDRFIREQIAGDELWPDDPDARIATAFNRHYPDESNARNLLQRRQEILNDITDTVGSVFTGLTFGCARCHDHKFDPILQTDYYRLQAFFANIHAADDFVLWPGESIHEYRKQLALWEEKTRSLRSEMSAILDPRRKEMVEELFDKYPPEIQSAITKPASERTPIEWQMYYKAKPYMNPDDEEVAQSLKDEAKTRWLALKADLDKFSSLYPADLPKGTGIVDVGRDAPKTYTLAVGAYDRPVQEVQPGFLSILDAGPAKIQPPAEIQSTGRRTALANWLADKQNPLTSRVMVNRLWHYHFGRGIVATPSDFGHMGERPSHPRLLDWLASEFISRGWSLKAVHRLILTSNTYQEGSLFDEAAAKQDPQNLLLWRFPRQRLEGEVIRDSALAVAELLNPKMGGPSVFPELPPGMASRGGWKVTEDSAERNRRSVYIFVRRNTRYPMLESFDMPDTHESCGRRNITTTAPQALALLNSKLTYEWAQAFAGRILKLTGPVLERQIETAYQLAYSRRPDKSEWETALAFFNRQRAIVAEKSGQSLALPTFIPIGMGTADGAALVDFCHILINSNEFVYRN